MATNNNACTQHWSSSNPSVHHSLSFTTMLMMTGNISKHLILCPAREQLVNKELHKRCQAHCWHKTCMHAASLLCHKRCIERTSSNAGQPARQGNVAQILQGDSQRSNQGQAQLRAVRHALHSPPIPYIQPPAVAAQMSSTSKQHKATTEKSVCIDHGDVVAVTVPKSES